MLPELLERLKHPDQWVRIETLRILAMVEEVRALNAIAQVYRTDPEPGVRQVAHWAGQIIYAAKRSARAQATAPDSARADRQEAFLQSLIEKDHRTYELMRLSLQREALREERLSAPLALPSPSQAPLDLMRLLDEGLSEDFFS
jgi:hypothetical protein